MIDPYAFATPNSIKVPISLEELGASYSYHPVNIRQGGEQKLPAFLALNPNGKVPVIVDPEGPDGQPITIAEPAAILIHLAKKFGLIPVSETGRVRMSNGCSFTLQVSGPRSASRAIPEARVGKNPRRDRTLSRRSKTDAEDARRSF